MRAPRLHVDGSARRQGPALPITPRGLARMGHREDFPRVTPRGVIRHTIVNRDICRQAHRLACSRRDRLHLPGVLPLAHREPGILARAPRAELDDLRAAIPAPAHATILAESAITSSMFSGT
jgi:hypothetical protein